MFILEAFLHRVEAMSVRHRFIRKHKHFRDVPLITLCVIESLDHSNFVEDHRENREEWRKIGKNRGKSGRIEKIGNNRGKSAYLALTLLATKVAKSRRGAMSFASSSVVSICPSVVPFRTPKMMDCPLKSFLSFTLVGFCNDHESGFQEPRKLVTRLVLSEYRILYTWTK